MCVAIFFVKFCPWIFLSCHRVDILIAKPQKMS
jgi:hypothetical protein